MKTNIKQQNTPGVNIPYVKKFNNHGEISNPITKDKPYLFHYPNRRQRKELTANYAFMGNVKHISLSVSGNFKYKRFIQVVKSKIDGTIKRIKHQVLVS